MLCICKSTHPLQALTDSNPCAQTFWKFCKGHFILFVSFVLASVYVSDVLSWKGRMPFFNNVAGIQLSILAIFKDAHMLIYPKEQDHLVKPKRTFVVTYRLPLLIIVAFSFLTALTTQNAIFMHQITSFLNCLVVISVGLEVKQL